MKKIIFLVTAIVSMYFISCKKKSQYKIEYLELYDKPLDEIRSTLNGKWQVHKTQGGFSGFDVSYPKNSFVEFKFGGNEANDSIRSYNDTAIFVNNKVTWSKKYTNILISDSTYLMKYTTVTVFPVETIVYKIKNDTLELRDNYPSGYSSFCTKVN